MPAITLSTSPALLKEKDWTCKSSTTLVKPTTFPTKGNRGIFESDDESESESSESEDEDDDDDDDIPLAKRIPSALTAQKSIRQQVRQESEKRKQQRVLQAHAETPRTRLMALRPASAAPSTSLLSSQTSMHRQPLEKQHQLKMSRSRTLSERTNPFSPGDLIRKLRDLNGSNGVLTSAPDQQQQRALHSRQGPQSMTRSLGDMYGASPTETSIPSSRSAISPIQRSKDVKEPSSSYHPYTSSSISTFPIPIPPPHHKSISRGWISPDRTPSMTTQGPVSTARQGHNDHHKIITADVDKSSRGTSHHYQQASSLPSSLTPVNSGTNKQELIVQQRVFVSNMQRFNTVEIGASTTAGDVIGMIEAEGSLNDFDGGGGWMVFEVAQDFGMERPIRSFELVADVQASWNTNKMVNYLVLRMTPLEVLLNRSAMPSSSPTHSGYVEWEAKRGKWSKRFLQLREHSIWLSKRENKLDQVHICSLSNFDAYQVTRTHRAPKPFSFAVKSTDNLSYFENTADYYHSFACSEKDGKIWMEKILVARSYVLFQERHVLFNPKAAKGNNVSGLSPSRSRK